MATRVQSTPWWASLLVLTSLSASLALRNYNLLISDIKCIVNPNYIANASCTVDNSPPTPRIQAAAQMVKVLKKLRMDFFVNLKRSNGDSIPLFRITDIDGCKVYATNDTFAMLKMFRDRLKFAGGWPTSCPFPADQYFNFRNLTLESDFLPSYIPDSEFKITITLKDNKLIVWNAIILGSVVNRRVQKGRRIS